jgi:hypothetical protein
MIDFSIAHGAAGLQPVAVGVRFKKHKYCDKKVAKEFQKGRITLYKLPDRLLYVGRGMGIKYLHQRRNSFDKYQLFDPWRDKKSVELTGMKHHMGNFHGDRRQSHIKECMEIWDSGALQLARGKADFIDPESYGHALKNLNTFGGVTIDFLPSRYDHSEGIERAKLYARLQKLNTMEIRKFSGDTRILNAVHGFTPHYRQVWLNHAIENNKDNSWCLSDINRTKSNMEKSKLLLSDFFTLKKLTKNFDESWFHILGMATHKYMAVILLLTPFVKKVTADAVSAFKYSTSGTMLYPSHECKIVSTRLRRTPNYCDLPTPCNCSMCELVGNVWAYSTDYYLLSWHNVSVINKNLDFLTQVFVNEGFDGYVNYLAKAEWEQDMLDVIRFTWKELNKGGNSYSSETHLMNSFTLYTSPRQQINNALIKNYIKYFREKYS